MRRNLIYLLIFIFLLSFLFFWLKKDGEKLFFKEQKQPISNGEELPGEPPVDLSEQADIVFSSDFKNDHLVSSLERYFLNQEQFSLETRPDSWRHCTIKNLEPENELFPFSVWVYCGEYLLEDGKWQELNGFSGPVKIDYPNELSYHNPSQFSHLAPHDSSYYLEDIENIFSKEAKENLALVDREIMGKINYQFVLKNNSAWEEIKEAISSCWVKQVFQAHSLQVKATLKDGTEMEAIEPKIDEVIDLVTNSNCRNVIMAIE